MPITLFRLAGVPVQMHLTCLVYPSGFFVLLAWLSHDQRTAVLILMLSLVSVTGLLVHEFAHVLVARYMEIGTRRVVFLPIGAIAELDDLPCGRCELAVAAAGPLASLALAGGFWLLSLGLEAMKVPWLEPVQFGCMLGAVINLALALFNLLPCFPMDGGRILRSLLVVVIICVFPRRADRALLFATRITVRYVARLVALGMMALTIRYTHIWLHLVLFPLLLVAAEIEYLRVREGHDAARESELTAQAPCS